MYEDYKVIKMDIGNELINKLKDRNINCQDIILDFKETWNTHTEREVTRLERLFLCQATLYNRNDVVKCLRPFPRGGNVNPLTIAVKQNNLELIKLFVDAGYERYSQEGDGFQDVCDISAMELSIKEQNVEAMLIMKGKQHDSNLFSLCLHHNSVKCLKKLLQEASCYREFGNLYSLMKRSISCFNLVMLKCVVEELKSDTNYLNFRQSQLVHKAAQSMEFIQSNQKSAQSLVEIIRYLVEHRIKVSSENTNDVNALHYMLKGIPTILLNDGIKQSISTICKILLDAMRRETGAALPVPVFNLIECVNTLYKLIAKYDKCHEEFGMQLLEMLLEAGVNPRPTNRLGWPLMKEVKSHLMNYNDNSSPTYYRVCENIYILLLSYGELPDYNMLHFLVTAMRRNFKAIIHLVVQAISMMDSDVLHEFRTCWAPLLLWDKHKDEFDCIRWEKSLKELCRCELYKHIPNRRMATHVDDLPLPKPLKKFLLLK